MFVNTNQQQQTHKENIQTTLPNNQLAQLPEWWENQNSVETVVATLNAIAGDQSEFSLSYNASMSTGPVNETEILVLGWQLAPSPNDPLAIYEYGAYWNSFAGWQIYRALKPMMYPPVQTVVVVGFQHTGVVYNISEHKPFIT